MPTRYMFQRIVPLCLLVFGIGTSVQADIPRDRPAPPGTFEEVLEHIHRHAIGNEWKKNGIQDEAIEGWLEKLVAAIAKAAGMEDFKLPVRMSEVRYEDPLRRIDGLLIIGKDIQITRPLRSSIILADGNVELGSSAQDCVIVARRAITVRSMTRHCVVVAGAYFGAQFDGEPVNGTNGSMIVTRGRLDLATAYGSILAAVSGVNVVTGQNAVFINSPVVGRDRGGSRSVTVDRFPLGAVPSHPLIDKVQALGAIQVPAPPPAVPLLALRGNLLTKGIVFRFDEKRYVANIGDQIVDEAGQGVESLRDWRVTFANEYLAIFSSGKTDAMVRIDPN